MKRLIALPDSAELGLIRSRLEAAGIECEMRNESSTIGFYGPAFYPEIWVSDERFVQANELLAAWHLPADNRKP